jgi:TRAP-type C4-dicarboxylate transport system substrate-binding protein
MMSLGKRILFSWVVWAMFSQGVTAQIVLRMGTLAPKDSTWHRILQDMGQQWKQATGGKLELIIFAGGSVGDEDEMIRKMRIGQLQCAAISASGLAEIDSQAYALMIPLLFQSYDEWDFVRSRVNPDLEEVLQKKGFVVLAWSDVGWVHFFSKEPLQRPEQLKKMKLAASATETASVDILKWAGFNPVPISTVDSVTGLQTGLIDCLYLPIIFAEGSNLFRYAGNMTDMKWAPLQGAVIVHEKAWNRLNAEQQRDMLQISRQAGERLRQDARQREKASLEAMRSRGLVVWEVNQEDRQEWLKSAERAYPRVRGMLVPAELFDRVVRLRDEFRSTHAASRQN